MTLLSNRTKWMLLTGFACLLAAGTAAAQTNPASCINDVDCVATPSCGGDICDWADTAHPMTCKAAGSHPKGMDGWCTVDTDCKCHDLGATCGANASCTFTRPCDAPDAGPCGTGGSGGSGGGGTSGGGGGGGGCSIAATAPTASSLFLAMLGLLTLPRRRRR